MSVDASPAITASRPAAVTPPATAADNTGADSRIAWRTPTAPGCSEALTNDGRRVADDCVIVDSSLSRTVSGIRGEPHGSGGKTHPWPHPGAVPQVKARADAAPISDHRITA